MNRPNNRLPVGNSGLCGAPRQVDDVGCNCDRRDINSHVGSFQRSSRVSDCTSAYRPFGSAINSASYPERGFLALLRPMMAPVVDQIFIFCPAIVNASRPTGYRSHRWNDDSPRAEAHPKPLPESC